MPNQVDPGFVYRITALNPNNANESAVVGFIFADTDESWGECWAMKPNWEGSPGPAVPPVWQQKPGSGSTKTLKFAVAASPGGTDFPTGDDYFERMTNFLSLCRDENNEYYVGVGGKFYFETKVVKEVQG